MTMRTPVGTGWLAREQAAKAALAARDAGHHPIASTDVGQQRAAMLKAQADATAAAQAEHERRIRETVTTCPCCAGRGYLSILDAAAALEAVESYQRVGWSPNTYSIGRVSKDAFTVDKDGHRLSETATTAATETVQAQGATKAASPITLAGADNETDAGSDEEAIAALDKPRRRR